MPLPFVVGIVVIIIVILLYNHLVTLSKRTDESLADINVQLKRRYDLIPNLLTTVQAYAQHEAELFENVARARTEALRGGNITERETAENMLTGSLHSLLAISEQYPALQADENFRQLQEELTNTENRIQAARRFYNMNVKALNTRLAQVPFNFIAKFTSLTHRDFFEIKDRQEIENITVKF